jgi:peroxiredoxin
VTRPGIGAPAPGFSLRDQHGATVALAELRGAPVLLVFFPFAFSRVCGTELVALRDALPGLAGAQVLGVSCDPVHTLRAYDDAERVGFGLLSDFWPHGAAATAYGVFDEDRGSAARSTFLLDQEGLVRWSVHNARAEPRSVEEYAAALRELLRSGGDKS